MPSLFTFLSQDNAFPRKLSKVLFFNSGVITQYSPKPSFPAKSRIFHCDLGREDPRRVWQSEAGIEKNGPEIGLGQAAQEVIAGQTGVGHDSVFSESL